MTLSLMSNSKDVEFAVIISGDILCLQLSSRLAAVFVMGKNGPRWRLPQVPGLLHNVSGLLLAPCVGVACSYPR